MHEAKVRGDKEVVVWGTGTPRREFLHSDDLASAAVHLMKLPDGLERDLFVDPVRPPLVNVGSGVDMTIRELATMVKEVVGFNGTLTFDTSKPDGTPRKLLDVGRISDLRWKSQISINEGLRVVYSQYLKGAAASV
jgi:GDP-L-fucose synthase